MKMNMLDIYGKMVEVDKELVKYTEFIEYHGRERNTLAEMANSVLEEFTKSINDKLGNNFIGEDSRLSVGFKSMDGQTGLLFSLWGKDENDDVIPLIDYFNITDDMSWENLSKFNKKHISWVDPKFKSRIGKTAKQFFDIVVNSMNDVYVGDVDNA